MGSEHSQRDVSLLERISVLPAGASADRGLGEGPTVGSTEEAALISKRQVEKSDAHVTIQRILHALLDINVCKGTTRYSTLSTEISYRSHLHSTV